VVVVLKTLVAYDWMHHERTTSYAAYVIWSAKSPLGSGTLPFLVMMDTSASGASRSLNAIDLLKSRTAYGASFVSCMEPVATGLTFMSSLNKRPLVDD
jgi:hypothetical protein